MNNTIEIPLSKKKTWIFILIAVTFVGIGIYAITWPPEISNPILGNPTVIFSAGILNIIIFGMVLILLIKMLFNKTPGLIISNEGIYDNSSFFSVGFVPWTNISDVQEIVVSKHQMINLVPKNPEDILKSQKNGIKRKLLQLNHNMTGLIACVGPNSLKITYPELKELLFKSFAKYQSDNNEKNN